MSRARRRPDSHRDSSSGWTIDLSIAALLVTAIFLIYSQTMHFGLVNYDDPDYVGTNAHVRAGLTAESVGWAFTHSFAGNWFPLTWLSHMLDVGLFGLDIGRHHLTSVCLHALATLLLFAALRRMTGEHWRSAMVAALFALHPLHVESVAWIAERKDVLSAFFWMLTLYAYACYAARPSTWRYALALLAFCLGLMAKPMLVTLPLVLMLLDYWPLARGVRWLEKIPFFVLSAVASIVTFVVHTEAGATASLQIFPLPVRIENALVSCAAYVIKFFWPSNLAVFYPYSKSSLLIPALLSAAALAAITLLALRIRRQYAITGWAWYLLTLAPVIGLIQVGAQARADRYTYIPSIGLSIVFVWGAAEVLKPWPRARVALGWSICAALAVLTWSQVGYWEDGVSLFRHAIDATGENKLARFNLAAALDERGESAEAAKELEQAVRIRPDSAAARAELGQLLAKQGKLQQALTELRTAEHLNPADASTHNRLGTVLGEVGQQREASAEFMEAARLDPDNADARYNLGVSLANQGNVADAAREFAAVVKLRPEDAPAHFNLGIGLARLGRTREAVVEFSEAVRLNPNLPGAREALEQARALLK
jgi:Flp pilus assembly protein TadD